MQTRQGMIACNNHMRNPISLHLQILKGVTHVIIVACYHLLPLSACMLNFDLVSILFGTSIPISVKMFLHYLL